MPTTQEILEGLNTIANSYSLYAILWHAIIYILLISLAFKWTPSNRLSGLLICIPLFSVAVFACLSGNPFNGILFSIMAVLILFFGFKTPVQSISIAQLPFTVIGIIMIIFGLVYPHFTETNSFLNYLFASPFGLIPCPTLSVLIGFVLLYNGFGSRPISLIFIIFGLFYGIFGVLKLAVHLDLFLLFGSLTLMVKYFMTIRQ